MKKILMIFGLLLGVVACKKSGSFLDSKADTGLTEATVFTDSARTMLFLAQIYQNVGFSFTKGRYASHGNTEQATDDAEYPFSSATNTIVIMYSGTMGPNNLFAPGAVPDTWSLPYASIRRVNLLLAKLPTVPLSEAKKKRVAAEARFLRAWYYHFLLANFGGIPLIGDRVFEITDIINLPRNSWAECIKYVSDELDAAAEILPAPNAYAEEDYGRATKAACMALKSRMLLYAASPLFNGGATTTGPVASLVSYPTYSVSHWQAAADAAAALIATGYHSLNVENNVAPGYGFYNVFLKRVNNEYIFAFNRSPNRDMEGFYNPPTRGGSKYSVPTHSLAEAFPMKNGRAITEAGSGYDPANPYNNRDPRFNYSIIYNGALYYSTTTSSKSPVFTYTGAPTDGYNPTAIGFTGYYSRKMCDENISSNSSFNTERGWPLIRYAEILLNYAEAINETGQTSLAYPKLVEIRRRAGIEAGADGLYGMKANMTVDEMRVFIQNERRIELMNEDHRWDDIRRWKTALVVNNGFNTAINITRNSNGTYSYAVAKSTLQHVTSPKLLLMPLPLSEVLKMPAMLQNPGY